MEQYVDRTRRRPLEEFVGVNVVLHEQYINVGANCGLRMIKDCGEKESVTGEPKPDLSNCFQI